MDAITLDDLTAACSPGGSSCLAFTTELTPAGGPHTSVAPAKYVDGTAAAYAYERRFLDGAERDGVVIDSKQSQNNRLECQLALAVETGDGPLAALPHLRVTYGDGGSYTDLTLPHRAWDGHVRAGTVDGTPVTQVPAYRAARDASPADARALLDLSPVSLLLGSWDASRKSRQGRWRSLLVGEIIGFLPGPAQDVARGPAMRGGARVDPTGMQVKLDPATARQLVADQGAELSQTLVEKLTKEADAAAKDKSGAKSVSGSSLGLGGIPPVLNQLAGVSCDRIIRTRVLSFAGLRQIRFGGGVAADAACRALLAAVALAGVARADAELDLRANCDLREAGPVTATLDLRGGELREIRPPSIPEADALLQEALERAAALAGVSWSGLTLDVTGNPTVVRGALDAGEGES